MICPNCKATIAENVKRCPYCSYNLQSTGGQTVLGKISLVMAFIALGCVIGSILLIFSGLGSTILSIVSILSLLCFLFSIIAIVLGAVAYFGKTKDRYGFVGFVLGICFLISGFIILPAATYVYVSSMLPEGPEHIEHIFLETPSIDFIQDDIDDTLTVVSINSARVPWSTIYISGTYQTKSTHYYVEAGDQITGCSGTITITYMPTDELIGSWTFT